MKPRRTWKPRCMPNAPGRRMDVMRLPEKYRTVILLIYLEGMTLQETARAIRVSHSTVCRRLGKARSLLKG